MAKLPFLESRINLFAFKDENGKNALMNSA